MSDDGPVVANSGPLIALSTVHQLDLLGRLFGVVLIPSAVFREVAEAGRGRPGAAEIPAAAWVTRVEVQPPPDALLAEELGPGEAEAITLAARQKARLLLRDDRRARRIATVAYALEVKGTAGLLVLAKRRGLLRAVRPLLEQMKAEGYYFSARVATRACEEAGE